MRLVPFLSDKSSIAIDEIRCCSDGITLVIHIASQDGECPLCGQKASRVHSSYERRLAELPWLGTPVKVVWRSRRFFCGNPRCGRRIFTERCPEIGATYARRTSRLNEALHALGLVCGGEAGARLAGKLGIYTSGDTLLRIIRDRPPPPSATPRVLGVDDWAICRGQRYGTILCDLERHCVVDLLPTRSAKSFAGWLKSHQGVEIISRDRGDFYIRGAMEGAPDAVQVTDRWHLLKNLRDTLVRILDRHAQEVQSTVRAIKESVELNSANQHTEDSEPILKPALTNARRQLSEQHRKARLNKFQEIMELHRQGVSNREIARRVGLHRSTVRRYVNADSFPERSQRGYKRGTDSYDRFLRRRWEEGCRNAKQLTRELAEQGFKGSYYMVRRRVAAWRHRDIDGPDGEQPCSARVHRMSSRRVAWMLLKSQDEQTRSEHVFATTLCERCPAIATVHRLAQEFNTMVRDHSDTKLDQWLDDVSSSELKNFGSGLEIDKESVHAALRLPWSNGQTEGQVNRLKNLKRQMYGRAKLDLLRLRLLSEQTAREAA